jgi:hypothetical protein
LVIKDPILKGKKENKSHKLPKLNFLKKKEREKKAFKPLQSKGKG